MIIGLVTSAIFVYYMHTRFAWFSFTAPALVTIISIAGISPLVPDLDHENGKLHNWLIGLGLIIALSGFLLQNLFGSYGGMIFTGLVLSASAFFTAIFAHHRGFMHSISFALLYAIGIYALTSMNLAYASLAFAGCLSHLIADKEFKLK